MTRRAGTSIVEVVIASAILFAGLGVVYSLIHQGARFGIGLGDREDADRYARSVLARYRGLPREALEDLVGTAGAASVEDLEDIGLYGFLPRTEVPTSQVRVLPIPGRLRSAALEVRVGSRRGRALLRRTLSTPAPGLGPELGQAPGFQVRSQVPTWGRADVWIVDAHRDQARDPPESAAALLRSPPPGLAAAWVGPDFRDGRDIVLRQGARDHAEDAAARGGFRRRHGSPEDLVGLRREALLGTFVDRTGVGSLLLGDRDIPEGDYRYTLDVLDRREDPDARDLVGVYELRGGLEVYQLVGIRTYGDAPRRRLRGDEVLESRDLVDSEGHAWRMDRTEEHLVVTEVDPGALERRLRIRNLPSMDGSRDGTSRTRRFRDEILARWDLTARASGAGPDELLEAAQRGRISYPLGEREG